LVILPGALEIEGNFLLLMRMAPKQKSQVLRNVMLATVVALNCQILAAPVFAQTQAGTQQQPGQANATRWIVSCTNQASLDKLACTMSQTVQFADTGQRVLTATITGNDENSELVLALPHGLDLPSGVVLGIDDGKTRNFPINTSDVNATYSRVPLSAEILAAMKVGGKVKLRVKGALGRAIDLELSLDGFAKAHELMAK
jgi:invasion protein IalB